MKYYFGDHCYYDSVDKEVWLNGKLVGLTLPQHRLLDYLIQHNGTMISHEELYMYMESSSTVSARYKKAISDEFTGGNGMLKKIPGLEACRTVSQKRDGYGGYCITIPQDRIVDDDPDLDESADIQLDDNELKPVSVPGHSELQEKYQELMAKADNGDSKSAYEVAIMHFYGFFEENGTIKRDYSRALHYFKLAAEHGDSALRASTLRMIGHMYYNGRYMEDGTGNVQSYEKAFEYIGLAADKLLSAKQHLAFMRTLGSGCVFNYEETKAFYLGFIDQADVSAVMHFADFLKDHGDFVLASKYYKKLLDEDHDLPEVAYQLGMIYKNGTHVSPPLPDYARAQDCFERCKTSDRYRARAYYEIGMLYFNPTGGFKKSFEKAGSYFEKAAEENHTISCYMLGYMYENGHIRTDFRQAIKYYRMAAEKGNILSAISLSYLYQQLEKPNFDQALKWAKWAADQGDGFACFSYASLLYLGRGCQKDLRTALKYFKLSEEYGFFEAHFMKQEIEKTLLQARNSQAITK